MERTISLLGGFCFFLSAMEYLIPRPLPFIRLGLANLPLLFALDIMPFPSFLLLAALKIAGQALISGTLFSYVFLFSLCGTGVSVLVMYGLRQGLGKKRISLIGIGAAGAMASNGAQLILAYFFVFGTGVRYAAVPFLVLGIITGTLLGTGAEYFIKRSRWYAGIAGSGKEAISPPFAPKPDPLPGRVKSPRRRETVFDLFRKKRETFCLKIFSSKELAAAGLCMIPALLLNPDTKSRIIQCLFFWILSWLSGKKNNPLITFTLLLGIIGFNLLVPYGELLFTAGPFAVTSGALWGGIRRAVTLEGLFMLSRCCIRRDLTFPGAFGGIAGESLRIFSILAGRKALEGLKNWAARLDELLLSFENETAVKMSASCLPGKTVPGSAAPGRIILAAAVILVWLIPLLWKAAE